MTDEERGPSSQGMRLRAWSRVRRTVTTHAHNSTDIVDDVLEASRRGMRALWISFAALTLTAIAQAVVVAFSGSAALFGDTLHNLAESLTAVPLAIAFLLGRRAATKRFTYGQGRLEDLAGVLILLVIAFTAALVGTQTITRLSDPQGMRHVGWVALAGVIGFVGHELVARYRIKVGRQIGSAALVADGLHARADGFTSLAVLAAAGGATMEWQWADPAVGLTIMVAIAWVFWGASKVVLARLVDAMDPLLVEHAEHTLTRSSGVRAVNRVRMRWVGHNLIAEADLEVDPDLTLAEGHTIAHHAEHALIHALPRLTSATIHVQPIGPAGAAAHDLITHHRTGAS